MKTQIVLTLDQLTAQERVDLAWIFSHALRDFRKNMRRYVVEKSLGDRLQGEDLDREIDIRRHYRDLAARVKRAAQEMVITDVEGGNDG